MENHIFRQGRHHGLGSLAVVRAVLLFIVCVGAAGCGSINRTVGSEEPRGVLTSPSIGVGRDYACALKPSGGFACWGRGEAPESRGSTGKALSVGTYTGCVLGEGKAVDCWVEGDGVAQLRQAQAPVRGAEGIVVLSRAGKRHCGIDAKGQVLCWGPDAWLPGGSTRATATAGVDRAISIASSPLGHVCAVLRDGTLKCWGTGTDGQLGTGGMRNVATPTAVVGLDDAVAVATGRTHTCAVRRSGAVACWGRGSEGQLGNGQRENSTTPVAVVGIVGAVDITAAGDQACVVDTSRSVWCWGDNQYGVLGSGDLDQAAVATPTPLAVAGVDDVVEVALGENATACARTADLSVYCWGNNVGGQLGRRGIEASTRPLLVRGIS